MKDQTFSPKYVEKMYDMGNRDGFGLMYVENDRVKTVKSMLGWKEIMEMYEEHMETDIAVHVRNASYGMPKDLDNCHPFKVLSIDDGDKIDLYMMHNGRFGDIQVDKKYSDSWNFATKFLGGYLKKHPSALQDSDFQYFLAGIIGNNKLVFLDNKKRFTIINKDLGAMHPTGVWVSTKQDIKLYKPIVTTPLGVSTKTSSEIMGGSQFGPGPAWQYAKNGKWEKDSDNRLHFEALSAQQKKESEKGESTEEVLVEETTDNGTTDGVTADALKDIIDVLPTMNPLEIYNFVVSYHKESLLILTSITKEDKNMLKLMISNAPWDAADMMLKYSKGNLGAVTA